MSSTIHSSRPTRPEKSFGEKLKEFFSSPALILMTVGGIALVLGVPYLALRTIPGLENPFTGETIGDTSKAKGDPNAGVDFSVLKTLPEELALEATVILNQEEPVMPEPLLELEQPSEYGLVYPVTEAVESIQPAFSWSKFADGPYDIAIYDAARMEVARARNVASLSWVVSTRLARGSKYSWKVTSANKDFQTASFIVMTEEQVTQWQEVRMEFKDSHLALGVSAEQLGLLTVAEREYKELARQFPQAEVPARLLANVMALRE